jgi:adenosylhomocysteine nucleosidase
LHKPPWIISGGFAGALQPELRRGHILLADEVVNAAGQHLTVGLTVDRQSIAATHGLHMGRLLTVDHIVRTPDERQRLGEHHAALACDMETLAVAEVCQELKTPLVAVRIISDAIDDELPPDIENLIGQTSLAGKLGAAAGAIFQRPSTAKDLWQIKEDALKASDRLARFLTGIVAQLPASPRS